MRLLILFVLLVNFSFAQTSIINLINSDILSLRKDYKYVFLEHVVVDSSGVKNKMENLSYQVLLNNN